jgi:hypothetical protein
MLLAYATTMLASPTMIAACDAASKSLNPPLPDRRSGWGFRASDDRKPLKIDTAQKPGKIPVHLSQLVVGGFFCAIGGTEQAAG